MDDMHTLTPALSHRMGVATWSAAPPGMETLGRALTLSSPVRRERVAEGRVRDIVTAEVARSGV